MIFSTISFREICNSSSVVDSDIITDFKTNNINIPAYEIIFLSASGINKECLHLTAVLLEYRLLFISYY